MTAHEFVTQAMASFSDDPMDRVSDKVRQMISHPGTLFDTHMHIFDKNCVTRNYFLIRLLENLDPDKKLDEALDKIIGNKKDNEFDELFNIMQFDRMEQVIDHYFQNFAYQQNMVTVPLMMDLDEGWYFNAKKKQHQQVKELKDLMATKAILPFLSVDPRKAQKSGKDNLYQLILDAFTPDANGNRFFGLKVYPALGYLPSDINLWPVYEVCEAKNIPIVVHCGGTIIRTYQNNYYLYGYQIDSNGDIVSLRHHMDIPNGKKRADFLNDPKHWEVVLKKYPRLKLNLAHFGGVEHWLNLAKTNRDEAIETINKLMAYDNVYADIAYNFCDTKFQNIFFKHFNNNFTIRNKTLYGTDYWMALAAGDFKKNHDKFITRLGANKELIMRTNPMKYLFGRVF